MLVQCRILSRSADPVCFECGGSMSPVVHGDIGVSQQQQVLHCVCVVAAIFLVSQRNLYDVCGRWNSGPENIYIYIYV